MQTKVERTLAHLNTNDHGGETGDDNKDSSSEATSNTKDLIVSACSSAAAVMMTVNTGTCETVREI